MIRERMKKLVLGSLYVAFILFCFFAYYVMRNNPVY